VKILSEIYNPILLRKEVKIEVTHNGEKTPDRFSVRKSLASLFKTDIENIYVLNMKTKTGTHKTVCDVEVYDSLETAKKIVPKHILARNTPSKEGVEKIKKAPKVKKP
jgi:ribosomal protein S24E